MAETTEQSKKPSFWSGFWFPAVFGSSAAIFREFVTFPIALILASLIATVVSYLALPKSKVGFVKFFLVIQVILAGASVGIWLIPSQLEKIIPAFWAYALPSFLVFAAIYFVPPLDGSVRDTAFWKWILGSVFFAGLFGYLVSLVSA